jgi:hypothetical protein
MIKIFALIRPLSIDARRGVKPYFFQHVACKLLLVRNRRDSARSKSSLILPGPRATALT